MEANDASKRSNDESLPTLGQQTPTSRSDVSAIEHEQSEAIARDESYKADQLSLNQKLVNLTLGLVIVGAVGMCVSIWQSWISKKAADAAAQSAETGERALNLTQRAFVLLNNFDVSPQYGPEGLVGFLVIVRVRNSGNTPALEAKLTVDTDDFYNNPGVTSDPDHPLQHPKPDKPKDTGTWDRSNGTLAPGQGVSGNPVMISMDEVRQLQRGELVRYFHGYIEYLDVFSKTVHHTSICSEIVARRIDPTKDPNGVIRIRAGDGEHNRSD